jgi:signal transduction histidine kinase
MVTALEGTAPGEVLYLPLAAQNACLGVLRVSRHKGSPRFGTREIVILETFAHQAALAVELARNRDDRDQLDRLEDRERIARNLHDTVIQRLFAVGMMLQAIARSAVPDTGRARLLQAVDEIDETIREIRTSIFALEAHQHRGLRVEVLELVHEVADRSGLQAHVDFDGPIDAGIPAALIPDLLAVLREALSNVARHARATNVSVILTSTEGIELRVVDDGVGMPEELERQSGLVNLARRAEVHGGALDVDSTPGTGTTLRWRVPAGTVH